MNIPTTEEATYDELYKLCQEHDISGRGDMNKAEMHEALTAEVEETGPTGLDDDLIPAITEINPYSDAEIIQEGDKVDISHLKTNPTVVKVIRNDEETIIEMETNHGGGHRLIIPEKGEPVLRRWRAKEEIWMKNSTAPEYITKK